MGVQVGSLFSSLTLESASFNEGMKKAAEQTAASTAKIEGHLGSLRKALEITFSAAAIQGAVELGKHAIEFAANIGDVSQQLGITSRDLQVYRFAATQAGLSQADMDKGLQTFTKTLGAAKAGVVNAQGVFKQLGFTSADIKRLDAHDALLKTADGISQIRSSAVRAQPEVKLFGDAGQKLDALLSQGSKGINALARAADDLGIVLSQDQIENAGKTANKLAELKMVLEASIAGAVSDNAAAIYQFVAALERMIAKVPDAISGILEFREKLKIGLADAVLAANYFNPTQAGRVNREDASARKADAEARLGQLEAGDIQRHPPAFARSSLDALSRAPEPASGGRSYTDPAAAAAAARAAQSAAEKAERERKAEEERRKRVADEGAKLDTEWLSAREQQTTDTVEIAMLARDKLTRDDQAKRDDIARDVAAGKIKPAEADELRLKLDRNKAIADDLVNRRENIALAEQERQVDQAALEDQQEMLGHASALATSMKDRLTLSLRTLEIEKAAERKRLQEIADDEARPASMRRYTQGDIDIAKLRLGSLDERYAGREAEARQQNAGPLARYRTELQSAVGDTSAAIEQAGVSAFGHINDAMDATIAKSLHLHGLFGDIVADLLKMETKKAILDLIGGTSSGGGGLLSRLFGGTSKAAISSDTLAGSAAFDASAASFASNIPKFATGGSFDVGGLGGTDSQLIKFWATPGEMVNITKGEGVSQRSLQVLVSPSPYFDTRVADVAQPIANDASVRGAAGGRALSAADALRRKKRTMR